ncbi:MAG: hypothetical protein ACREEV_09530 [Dongiaceae bacterium]
MIWKIEWLALSHLTAASAHEKIVNETSAKAMPRGTRSPVVALVAGVTRAKLPEFHDGAADNQTGHRR